MNPLNGAVGSAVQRPPVHFARSSAENSGMAQVERVVPDALERLDLLRPLRFSPAIFRGRPRFQSHATTSRAAIAGGIPPERPGTATARIIQNPNDPSAFACAGRVHPVFNR